MTQTIKILLKEYYKVLFICFAGVFFTTLFSGLAPRGWLMTIEIISIFNLSIGSIYLLSLLSQQKPKKEKTKERMIIKSILIFHTFIFFTVIFCFILLAKFWENFLSKWQAAFFVSVVLSILVLYPIGLVIYKKSKHENKGFINKASIVFIISILYAIYEAYI